MTTQTVRRVILGVAIAVVAATATQPPVAAQEPAAVAPPRGPGQATPPLFFREAWQQRPDGQQHQVEADVVSNPDLDLKLYGATANEILVTGTPTGPAGVVWLFNGLSTTPIAVTLRHRDSYVDLSGAARVRWTIRTAGFHVARPVVKLADGTWLIGDRADTSPDYFNEIEFSLATLRWLPFDVERVVTTAETNGQWILNPDLTRVDEVGYADLMPGSGHGFGGWASLGPIEVYGTAVAR